MAPRVKRVDLRGHRLDPVELFVKHHIIGLRHSKTGYIRQVKHVEYGWMTPQEYYRLQTIHNLPWVGILEGAYRLKMALWSTSLVAGPVSLPVGASIPGYCILMAIRHRTGIWAKQDNAMAALWLALIAIPFSEPFILWQMLQEIVELPEVLEGLRETIRPVILPPPALRP